MEFDKTRVYTALNADELRAGDKVIVANSLAYLQDQVEEDDCVFEIRAILTSDNEHRFRIENGSTYTLAYLVERAENCTNCGNQYKYRVCDFPHHDGVGDRCEFYKPKAEKHYRQFANTDELIKVWEQKFGKILVSGIELTIPLIWVRQRNCSKGGLLITYFGEDEVRTDMGFMTMSKLLRDYTFTDGSPCGVEE